MSRLEDLKREKETLWEWLQETQMEIDDLQNDNVRRLLNPDTVMNCVCDKLNITPCSIKSKIKYIDVCEARWLFIYILRMECNYGIRRISFYMNMHRTSIDWAIKRVNELMEIDKRFKRKFLEVHEEFQMIK